MSNSFFGITESRALKKDMAIRVFSLVCCVCLVNSRLTFDTLSDRVVTTNAGRLRGVQVDFDGTDLQSVEAYLGVQYASLHNGALRFMPPTSPTEKWNGVKIANVFRPVCPQQKLDFDKLVETMPAARADRLRQISEYTKSQSEECLFLNIYIPARDRKGPAPVVVFVHGESYDYGTGNAYDGSVLSSQADIVVVTLNYRLGPLGFLSTGDGLASGNYALFDLIAAVHWIKANIADFGGDSSQVTLMGQGYGAALANMLSLAPITGRMEKDGVTMFRTKFGLNLFNRLMLQSGSALSSWAMSASPVGATKQLAGAVNCPLTSLDDGGIDSESLLMCLREVSYTQLMNANLPSNKFVTNFGPVVDNVILEATPEQLMNRGDTLFSNIELLFGLAKYEGSIFLPQRQLDQGVTVKERAKILKEYVKSNYQVQRQKIYDILDHTYSDWDDRNNTAELKHKVIELLGDGQYNVPSIQAGQHHLEGGKGTYFYVFSHSSRAAHYPNYQNGHHGEELPYLFGAPLSDEVAPFVGGTYSNAEKILCEAVIRFFGNFIKSGNPNIPLSEKSPSDISIDSLRFLDVYWPQYEFDTQKYLQLGTRPLVNHHYRRERVALWTELIPKLHQSSTDGAEDADGFLDNDFVTRSPKDVGVRHVLPQPPTPPIIHPYRPATSTRPTQGDEPEVVIEKQPITRVVTKVVEVIKYRNITAKPVIAESKEWSQMSTALSITIGVGAAFLFLNVVILIGVCCQRDRLRAERKVLKKMQQTGGAVDSTTPLKIDTDANQSQQTAKMLDAHLYEKAQESYNKQSGVDGRHGTSSSSDRSPKGDANLMEQGLPLSRHNDYSITSYKSEVDTDSERLVIKGVPQEPAKPPQHLSPDMPFETCGNNYRSQSRSGSRQHLNDHRGSQNSLSLSHGRSRELSPRNGYSETPVPRQRTPESLSRINSLERRDSGRRGDPQRAHIQSPRHASRQNSADDHYNSYGRREMEPGRSYDSNSYRKMSHPNPHMSNRSISENGYYTDTSSPRRYHQSPRTMDEHIYRSPRRLKYPEDGGSSDSGVQHVM